MNTLNNMFLIESDPAVILLTESRTKKYSQHVIKHLSLMSDVILSLQAQEHPAGLDDARYL